MPRKFQIEPEASRLEAAEAALWEAGALAITLLDAADQPLLEPGPGEMPLWQRVTLEALLPDAVDPIELALRLTAMGLIDAPTAGRLTELPERDWTRAWMDRFKPMRFGNSIWICPSHIEPEPDWPVVVRLDPGLAFGSGTHPTTALCLEWLDGLALEGRRVIDYGAGSGILAVAAALKGAAPVLAVDHDLQALLATADNAQRNGVAEQIEALLPADLGPDPAQVVVANILAGPLIELAAEISARIAPGGRLALSGILAEQADAVREAYAAQLEFTGQGQREEWILLSFQRPDAG
ncbi:MAG: 50S ribosomal protein L11 methyltransferase [Gammaproteobacteria bacterium HGW-Gammaproteobacteria-8]|nr:MAG: 50S ribosomal protein L11 methyltransferase [Gammaproteobacteria bacterium HGW-Gammaproteobacteria-8]